MFVLVSFSPVVDQNDLRGKRQSSKKSARETEAEEEEEKGKDADGMKMQQLDTGHRGRVSRRCNCIYTLAPSIRD